MDYISNEVFLAAQENLDNKKLIKSILNKYHNVFSPQELENIGNIALWNCLQKHRDDMGQKFTTSLFNHVRWQILVELRRFNKDNRINSVPISSGTPDIRHDNAEHVDVLDALNTLEPNLRDVVYEYYIENRTLSEISKRYDICMETTRKRIKSGLEKLKISCS